MAAALTVLALRREARAGSRRERLGLPRWSRGRRRGHRRRARGACPIVAGGANPPGTKEVSVGATNQRLSELGSNRPEYWRVALDVFKADPVEGVGSSGFAVEWLQKRRISEGVHDAHSLEIETLAELGLVGVALLAALLSAARSSAIRRAHGARSRARGRPARGDRRVDAALGASTGTGRCRRSRSWP